MDATDAAKYPDPDLVRAYGEIAKELGVTAMSIGDIAFSWAASTTEPVPAVGFSAPFAGGDDPTAGDGTTPRDQRSPRLWRDGKAPGFRRAPKAE